MRISLNVLLLIAVLLVTAAFCEVAPAQERYTGDPKWLDGVDRDNWQMPERVMDTVGILPYMQIGEVGAGGGYFTVWLARRVGPKGHVYANEINSRYLDYIKERCEKEEIFNVTTILGEEADPLFPAGALDMVIMVNVYHELSKPNEMMKAIIPSLKPGGTVVIVDYDEKKRGPRHTAAPEEVIEEVAAAGYELLGREDYLPRQFILILRPTER